DVITCIVFVSSYEDGRVIFELQAQQMVYATEAYQNVFIGITRMDTSGTLVISK
ncbi:hypothetical protein HAX54_029041, partial [Datura stramonium]|nr:hypothetical protein [Datura stramonium]